MKYYPAPSKKHNGALDVGTMNLLINRSANILNKRQPPVFNYVFVNTTQTSYDTTDAIFLQKQIVNLGYFNYDPAFKDFNAVISFNSGIDCKYILKAKQRGSVNDEWFDIAYYQSNTTSGVAEMIGTYQVYGADPRFRLNEDLLPETEKIFQLSLWSQTIEKNPSGNCQVYSFLMEWKNRRDAA